jgi:hypothetical protein
MKTAIRRPTATSSANLSMMAVTFSAANKRACARYKFQNRNRCPLLAVVLPPWPNRSVLTFLKNCPNITCF